MVGSRMQSHEGMISSPGTKHSDLDPAHSTPLPLPQDSPSKTSFPEARELMIPEKTPYIRDGPPLPTITLDCQPRRPTFPGLVATSFPQPPVLWPLLTRAFFFQIYL